MRITGRQLRRIIQEEVSRMMNEADAPDVERKKIAMLTSIANGRIITDANATKDERMLINSMLDQYITGSGDPALAPLVLNTLPTASFARKLRAVQAALGVGVDGLFGEDSMLGLVRAGGKPAESIEDIIKNIEGIVNPSGAPHIRQPTAAELGAMIVQDKKSTDLGRPLVDPPLYQFDGVQIGYQNLTPTQMPVLKTILQKFSAEELMQIRNTAVAMERKGQDSMPFIKRKLGATTAGGGMMAQVLLDYLGIGTDKGSGNLGRLEPFKVAPTSPVEPFREGHRMPERKRYRS